MAGKLQTGARLGYIADRAVDDVVAVVEDDSSLLQGRDPLSLSLFEADQGFCARRQFANPHVKA
jgi:hypothetical protein